jgi:hypothetical protein
MPPITAVWPSAMSSVVSASRLRIVWDRARAEVWLKSGSSRLTFTLSSTLPSP